MRHVAQLSNYNEPFRRYGMAAPLRNQAYVGPLAIEALEHSIEQQVRLQLGKVDTLDEQYFYVSTLDTIVQQHRVLTALIWPF